jgi:hypothetical protein
VTVHRVGSEYGIDVVVNLPDGCYEPGSYRLELEGNKVDVLVRNIFIPPLATCADIQGQHVWTITLTGDFAEGQTYEIVVNDDTSVYFTYAPPLGAE